MAQTNSRGETFGAWLCAQGKRAALVASTKSDRAFLRIGEPDELRRHLVGKAAHSDMSDAIDGAEANWSRP